MSEQPPQATLKPIPMALNWRRTVWEQKERGGSETRQFALQVALCDATGEPEDHLYTMTGVETLNEYLNRFETDPDALSVHLFEVVEAQAA